MMTSQHRIFFGDAGDMEAGPSQIAHLVVTSPPYPMIEMWDETFTAQDIDVGKALEAHAGWEAFEHMHEVLDCTWRQLERVLIDGGIACINIGDATRSIGGNFALYPNRARILRTFLDLGFTPLPDILWCKQTNAPNKFMGSGMLPPGAYVTLEHEYILVLRKGGKREFPTLPERANRRASAIFWEERNKWFSDVWSDLKGVSQKTPGLSTDDVRVRSGAFPFELPYRLINMFSVKGDTVLDPFLGTGTTTRAAMASARNSIGVEIEGGLAGAIHDRMGSVVDVANALISKRLSDHSDFVRRRYDSKGKFGYPNETYGFPVVTKQETNLFLNLLNSNEELPICPGFEEQARRSMEFETTYSEELGPEHRRTEWDWFFKEDK